MAFDPDKYLAETAPAQNKNSSFDPDKYLAETSAPVDDRSGLQVMRDALDVTNWPKNMLAGVHKVDETINAPVRKFITEALTGKEMEKAPTGSEQAKMMGATDKTFGEVYGVHPYAGGNISPADIYGVALEAVQDPLLLAGKAVQGAKNIFRGGEAVADAFRAKQAVNAGQAQRASMSAEAGSKAAAEVGAKGSSAEISGKMFDYKAPQSLDELKSWKPPQGAGQMLGKSRLQEIEATIPDLRTKPLKYHYDMMENPKAMKALKLEFENLPTDSAKQIAAYNQEIVDESARKIQQTVKEISPSEIRSMTDAGDDLISTVKDRYKAEKEMLGPVFDELQKSPRLSRAETMGLAQGIAENTKLGKLIATGEDGKLFLQKNTPRTGISDAEHSALSRVIEDMNDGMSFKELQNAREFLRKSMDSTNQAATAEIGKVRSFMLGQMEEMAANRGGNVGATFKKYAMNERAREDIESIIGGRIESLDAMYAANPDRVVKKIFSNPNHVSVVESYVGPEKMREMVGSYIQNGLSGAFDSAKGFNPSKAKQWLKTNETFMQRYAQEAKQRLEALADYGYYGKRFLDEVNPSGTAASLKEALQPGSFMAKVKSGDVWGAVKSEAAARTVGKLEQRQAIKSVNEMMGAPKKTSAAEKIKGQLASPEEISARLEKGYRVQQVAATARGTIQEAKQLNSADQNEPKKGPDKWANDGIDMILRENQSDIDRETLEKLKASKNGKQLLIEASSAKNKKAMEKVLQKIRSANAKGGE